MSWLQTLARLGRSGDPFVMVTVARVRGHAPRSAGAKMLVAATEAHGSVGGGNLEATAVARARELLAQGADTPELVTIPLTPRDGRHGVQCCGGEVTLLLEPIAPSRETVAVFGAGHVGRALLQVLSLLPIRLRLVDAREGELARARTPDGAAAEVTLEHAPVPETVVPGLPAGSHLVILSHDHAEDLAILDVALRRQDLGFLGLIGSSVKWQHFRSRLLEQGHDEAALARVTTPIGLPGVPGKTPQAIAIATAAQLLLHLKLPDNQP